MLKKKRSMTLLARPSNTVRTVAACLLVLTVTACGGGGSSSTAGPSDPDAGSGSNGSSSNDAGGAAPDTTPTVSRTADLIASENFQFATDTELLFQLDMPAARDSVYVSLCHPTNTASGADTKASVDYENCLLRTWVKRDRLIGARFSQAIQLMSHIDQLVAVVFDPVDVEESSYRWFRTQGMHFVID